MATRPRALFSAFLATTVLLATVPILPHLARAEGSAVASEDAKAKAAELKKKGDAAMDGLKYGDAIVAYDAAYALDPDPALHFNKGRALQALGRFPDALEELERFRKDAPPDLLAKVPKLDDLIADVRLHIAQLQIVCKVPGARVLVRDRLVGTTPITGNVPLSVGPATVEVTAEGYFPWKKSIELPPGGLLTVNVDLVTKSTKGILVVKSGTAGSTVFIDDGVAGTAPVEVALDAGSHKIVLRRDGYDEAETSAIVPVGERREMTVDLAKKAPITSQWWFWTGVGVVVVGGVALTAALLTEKKAGHGDLPPGQTSGPLLRF
jgi:hypothetical protein